jgi:hypothetical protein
MLSTLLKNLAPQQIAEMAKNNPSFCLAILQNFKTFQLFGECLSTSQQICLSNNLPKINEFLMSSKGKTSISIIAEEFVEYVKSLKPVELHNEI